MAKTEKTKLKILYIADILKKKTDEQNPLSANEIAEELEALGIPAERKSIYKDIENLREYGMDIIATLTPKRGFFLGERDFELAEIRLLTDAIQAANFISAKKSKSLIAKIENFVSDSHAESLRGQIYIDNRQKCKNEEIYYTIDTLNRAIKEQKQVSFLYTRRVISGNFKSKYEEKPFTVNPYAMIWANDHYYLICNNPKYDNLMHTRIDRIKSIDIQKAKARNFSEITKYKDAFDCADYANTLSAMFSGEQKTVDLICQNAIIEEILDRFGEPLRIISMNDKVFQISVNLAISEGLVSWPMQYGDKIIVTSPAKLKIMIKQRAAQILNQYK